MVSSNNAEIKLMADEAQKAGCIFDIQRFSVNDGPGIRTTVFLKGCPLSCAWCSNPESQNDYPQLLYNENLCRRCYQCLVACPVKANDVTPDGTVTVDRDKCTGCGECAAVCPTEARVIVGRKVTIPEVMTVIKRDELFYRNSGGGVTASGGEPTQQPDFVRQLFAECHRGGVHTTLDTCGYAEWKTLEDILQYTDLVYYDLKHMDSHQHQKLTGVGNEVIIENARRISANGKPLVIRIPLIMGLNDSTENIRETAEFVRELNFRRVDLLPLHHLGSMKYRRLGRQYQLSDTDTCNEAETIRIKKEFASHGLDVNIA